jgi:TetR/AcrR family fatty acid metabolism transcriptional regulator
LQFSEAAVRTKTPEQADKILEAASQLFGRRRFHEVRMEDIAAEAEVGKGTLYRYFADKEELYLALLQRAAHQYRSLIDAEAAKNESPRKKLRGLVAAGFGFFDKQPHLSPLIQRAEATHADSPWQPVRDAFIAHVEAVLEEAHESGEFSVAEPHVAALLLLGGIRSIYLFTRKPRPRDLADRLVELWLNGVAVPALAEVD